MRLPRAQEAIVISSDMSQKDLAKAYCDKGDAFIQQNGRELDALAAYESAMNCGANSVEIHQKNIHPLLSLGRYSEATREHDQIIRLSSTPLAACKKKIKFLLKNGWRDEAFTIEEIFATYEQILQRRQGAVEVYYQVIRDLETFVIDNHKRLVIYDRTIAWGPDKIKVDVYYKKVALMKQIRLFNEIPTTYDQIIKLAPGHLDAYYEKLAALEQLEWNEEALATCDQIILRVSNDLTVLRKRPALLALLKRYDQIEPACEAILALDPNCDEAYYRRGEAYEILEKSSESISDVYCVRLRRIPLNYLKALADYEKASHINPDNADYRECIGALLCHLGNSIRLKKHCRALQADIQLFHGSSGRGLFYSYPLPPMSFLLEDSCSIYHVSPYLL